MLEEATQIVITALLAGAGSVARLLNQKHGRHIRALYLISSCFVAMFAGIIAYYIGRYFELDANIAYVFAGICGWAGPHTLDVIAATALQKAGVAAPKKETET